MIEFNLLPDVKLQYIKAERQRRLIFSVSFVVTVVAVVILVLLLIAGGLQRKHLRDLDNDINRNTSTLKNKPQIDRILTVQNQLDSLKQLHDGKPAASRLFGYLNQITPTNVGITSYQTDFTAHTATITGTSDAISSVNKYVDTLKFTTYTVDGGKTNTKAFSDIVLASFSLNTGADAKPGQAAAYSITLSYDPVIFDIAQKVTLTVPTLTTTRSAVDSPAASSDLFQTAPKSSKAGS